MRFVIPGRLAGLNEIINANRGNRYAGAGQKKKETVRCGIEIIRQAVPRFETPVSVLFRWIEQDIRRDPDNICAGAKFILDALVETGKLHGDGRKWVRSIVHLFAEPDKTNPRIEVEVTEFNESA